MDNISLPARFSIFCVCRRAVHLGLLLDAVPGGTLKALAEPLPWSSGQTGRRRGQEAQPGGTQQHQQMLGDHWEEQRSRHTESKNNDLGYADLNANREGITEF